MTRYIYLGITLVCIIQQISYGCSSTRDEIENKFRKTFVLFRLLQNAKCSKFVKLKDTVKSNVFWKSEHENVGS